MLVKIGYSDKVRYSYRVLNTNIVNKNRHFPPCLWFKINFKKNNFMAPFYGWGLTASRLQPLRGGSVLFTIQFPEIPGTHFIDLGRVKG